MCLGKGGKKQKCRKVQVLSVKSLFTHVTERILMYTLPIYHYHYWAIITSTATANTLSNAVQMLLIIIVLTLL